MREERQRQVEEHVSQVTAALQEHQHAGRVEPCSEIEEEEWSGFSDELDDHKEEYIDEERYTTVIVESVAISRDGLHAQHEIDSEKHDQETPRQAQAQTTPKRRNEKKKKRKKFRYETKFERDLQHRKRKADMEARRKDS